MSCPPFNECAVVVKRERTLDSLATKFPNWNRRARYIKDVIRDQLVDLPCRAEDCWCVERMRVSATWREVGKTYSRMEDDKRYFYRCRLLPDEWLHVGSNFFSIPECMGECELHQMPTKIAVGMVLHERLGANSKLAVLKGEVMMMIIDMM